MITIGMEIIVSSATVETVDIEELVDDFVIFFAGGQATVSSMLTFALVLTLLHPNVLERYITLNYEHDNTIIMEFTSCMCMYRVQSEVDEVLGMKDYVSAEDLKKLDYVEQV